jgi:hypothetical protein
VVVVEESRGRSKARFEKWRTGHGTQDLPDAKLLRFSNTPGTAPTKAPSPPPDTAPYPRLQNMAPSKPRFNTFR